MRNIAHIKVFASGFLEPMDKYSRLDENWEWEPANDVKKIYASGAPTSTNQSTYAGESDNRSDSDRPNEGLMAV